MHQRNLIAFAIEMHKNSNDVNELYIPYYTLVSFSLNNFVIDFVPVEASQISPLDSFSF